MSRLLAAALFGFAGTMPCFLNHFRAVTSLIPYELAKAVEPIQAFAFKT